MHRQSAMAVKSYSCLGRVCVCSGEDSTLRCFSTVHDSHNKSLGRASYNKTKTKRSRLQLDEHRMPPIIHFASGNSLFGVGVVVGVVVVVAAVVVVVVVVVVAVVVFLLLLLLLLAFLLLLL